MTDEEFKARLSKENAKGGFARWKHIGKRKRSAEMKRIAIEGWKKRRKKTLANKGDSANPENKCCQASAHAS